ncbi:thiosulfate sulfurtransferase [Blumeria hordei DH14]|uniref:Thiosulfate sulfurtransferase n=1 Tax=Blumeria graminis f. sp. hordei (strain DH14) TaxID=546991 RepID=N1JG63_BLUG1|nr:thiosulfate sulfurtransferase [Blumeria hordei DH14]
MLARKTCLRQRSRLLSSRNVLVDSSMRHVLSTLVTPEELHARLQPITMGQATVSSTVVPLCATWFLPTSAHRGLESFRTRRLPNARFFDIDEICDKESPFPHMLPSASDFAKAMSTLGVRKHDTVVVYDSLEQGIFSAPRVAWMLKAFGHSSVHVLNNFRGWVDRGYPTESGDPQKVDYHPYPIPELDSTKLVGFDELKEIVQSQQQDGVTRAQILDARSFGRWSGKEPEPRTAIRSGHIPGSISISVSELLDADTKAILPAHELAQIFKRKNVDPGKPIITSCGTGVTAAIINMALDEAGYGSEKDLRLYDGSWTEWAQRNTDDEDETKRMIKVL